MQWRSFDRTVSLCFAGIISGLMLVLAGCGGGGGGGHNLNIYFKYDSGGHYGLFEVPGLLVSLTGLDGNSPNCTLASGSALPQGVHLDAGTCLLQGVAQSTGSFVGTVNLTVGGFDGTISATYSFDVNSPSLTPAQSSDVQLIVGTSIANTVAVLHFYSSQPGDITQVSITQGRLQTGLSIGLNSSNLVSLSGTPTEVGRQDLSIAFTLQRSGHVIASQAVPFSVVVSEPTQSLDYTTCCTAYTGVPMRYSPRTSFVPANGASIQYVLMSGAGSLPVGLQLDSATGDIYGIPTTGDLNNITFSIRATMSIGGVETSHVDAMWYVSPVGAFGTYPTSSLGTTAYYESGPSSPPYGVSHAVPADTVFSIAPGPMYAVRDGDQFSYRLTSNSYYGNPVPSWMSVDPATGVLTGKRPAAVTQGLFMLEITLLRGGGRYVYSQFWSIR